MDIRRNINGENICLLITDINRRRLREQIRLDTLVVFTVKDNYSMLEKSCILANAINNSPGE